MDDRRIVGCLWGILCSGRVGRDTWTKRVDGVREQLEHPLIGGRGREAAPTTDFTDRATPVV